MFLFRTVDSTVFKLVVSLCPLTLDDSPHLHLLAVTQSGVRLYFSTTSLQFNTNPQQTQPQQHLQQPQQQLATSPPPDRPKPQNLYLLHVRLPPGYTSNVNVVKPKSVHTAFYKEGTLLMVSTPQQDQDLLWSLSSEPFPLRQYLAESSTIIPLQGQVWSVAEVRSSKPLDSSELQLVNPMSNAKTNRKVVLLTNQGAHIVAIVKPVYMLQQLLLACHGPHHESVKAYFKNQSAKQACATSVLLACMASFRGTEVGMWATQAFILYGGEPQYDGAKYLMNQSHPKHFNSSFNGVLNSISNAVFFNNICFFFYLFKDPQRYPLFMSTPFTGNPPSPTGQHGIIQNLQYPLSPSKCFETSYLQFYKQIISVFTIF